MKTNNIFYLFLIASAAVSCSEMEQNDPTLSSGEEYVTFTCSMATDATKTTISDSGVTPTPTWEVGDGIYIRPETTSLFSTRVTLKADDINPDNPSQASFSIRTPSGSSYYDALFPSSAYTTEVGYPTQLVATVPGSQNGSFGSGHVAACRSVPSTVGNFGFFFSNITNFIQFTLQSEEYGKITLKGNDGEVIAGPVRIEIDDEYNSVSISRYESDYYTGCREIQLDITNHGGNTYYIGFVPTDFKYGFTLSFYKKGEAFASEQVFVSKRADFSKMGKIFNLGELDAKLEAAVPEGAVRGKFSVSETRKVYFSSGNLIYTVSSGKWSFYEKQYETAKTDGTPDMNVISSHCWGYDPAKSIIPDEVGIINRRQGNLTYEEDWGSTITTAPYGTWHTPSWDEWEYIISKREMTYGKDRYTRTNDGRNLKIEGIDASGLFLYPDDFNGKYVDDKSAGWTWGSIKNAGIVFLPTISLRGYFQTDTLWELVGYALYWTSSGTGERYAGSLEFSGLPRCFGPHGKDVGQAVRLIANCE